LLIVLVHPARIMTYPEDYKYVHDALVNSLSFETDSYKHFSISFNRKHNRGRNLKQTLFTSI